MKLFSNDTILMFAVFEVVLNDHDYEKYIRKYGNDYIDYKPDFAYILKLLFHRDLLNG